MHQNCVYKLWYYKNRNSWKEKHLQKRKGRRGGLPAKPVAGSDRSLDSDALQSASVGHRFFTSSFLGEDNSETYSVHQNLCMWSLCGKLRSTNKSKEKEEAKNREEIIPSWVFSWAQQNTIFPTVMNKTHGKSRGSRQRLILPWVFSADGKHSIFQCACLVRQQNYPLPTSKCFHTFFILIWMKKNFKS
jgi:hypothetical protein